MINGRTDGRTDRHTDVQRETIIPRHYCVAGYKNARTLFGGIKALTALVGPLSLSIGWENGFERGLKTVSFYPYLPVI